MSPTESQAVLAESGITPSTPPSPSGSQVSASGDSATASPDKNSVQPPAATRSAAVLGRPTRERPSSRALTAAVASGLGKSALIVEEQQRAPRCRLPCKLDSARRAAPVRPTQQRAGAPSGAVESPGGFAPPGARRSRREPLDSPGSCHPAVGCAPDAQCANRPRSRLAIAARNRAVRVGWPRNRLYFRMAQRIRYLLMSLRVWISSVR
jgi:hypothetical protein